MRPFRFPVLRTTSGPENADPNEVGWNGRLILLGVAVTVLCAIFLPILFLS